MKVTCSVDIKDDDIIGVLDSGFAYINWWDDIKIAKRGTITDEAYAGHVMSGGAVAVVVDDKYGDTGALIDFKPGRYVYRLDRESVEKGIQALANDETYKHHFGNILHDNTDATTGHVLIQFALFGTVIFD